MKLLGPRRKIRTVATRWREQYPVSKYAGTEFQAIGDKLEAMNVEMIPVASVDAIIGNKSWTHELCAECDEYAETVIRFGNQEGVVVCLDCVKAAARIGG